VEEVVSSTKWWLYW